MQGGEQGRTSAAELKDQIATSRDGAPFLVHRDDQGTQVITRLDDTRQRLVIGRSEEAGIALTWDEQASRAHAELERMGGDWTIADDGLSTNGTFVNGERVRGRQRLSDGDRISIGRTALAFRAPSQDASQVTVRQSGSAPAPISAAQRRVLIALCRPYRDGGAFATPPTNQQIAEELFLSVDAVKTHMRALFQRFAIEDLAQNQKRARLAEVAFASGEVAPHDLDAPA